MEINELKLPALFVRNAHEGKFHREFGSWELKKKVDAFGNYLETEIGQVFIDIDSIIRETKDLPEHFAPDGFYGEPVEDGEKEPGFIPDIIDFSKIVCFAISGDGSCFCFDFREDKNNPSIIWWDDVYWRQIATNYETFIILFNFSSD